MHSSGVPALSSVRHSHEMGACAPLGGFAEAHEAAAVIRCLVSEWASYVTGVAINVDEGTSNVV